MYLYLCPACNAVCKNPYFHVPPVNVLTIWSLTPLIFSMHVQRHVGEEGKDFDELMLNGREWCPWVSYPYVSGDLPGAHCGCVGWGLWNESVQQLTPRLIGG